MQEIINTEKVSIKLWLKDIDKGGMEQARNITNLHFVRRHIAIMPDAHRFGENGVGVFPGEHEPVYEGRYCHKIQLK